LAEERPPVAAGGNEQLVNVVFVVRRAEAPADVMTVAPADRPAAAAATPGAAEAAGAEPAIENAEILTVTVEDSVDAKASNVRVAEDGTIDVPQAGKVKAVGRTPRQVELDIEARWRNSKAGVAPGTRAKVQRPTDDTGSTAPANEEPAQQ
jgi:protein involved in polysaccharide export with SLBB domain